MKTSKLNLRTDISSRLQSIKKQKRWRRLPGQHNGENNSAHFSCAHVFTQPGSKPDVSGFPLDVRFTSHKADVATATSGCAINGQPFAPIFNCLASGSGSQLLECSDVTDFPTKKRRSVTTSFSACRITATVDASYFCFRSVIVAVQIVAAP